MHFVRAYLHFHGFSVGADDGGVYGAIVVFLRGSDVIVEFTWDVAPQGVHDTKGGVAIGTALIVPGDEALVERIREVSESFGGEVGISAWNGFAMARFCAQDAARLRTDMMAVLGRASGSALPRLWLN